MSNFFNSTNIATVFLDEKLNIRKFTPAASKEINLKERQIGLPIGDLLHNLKYEQLADDALKVLLTGELIENEVQGLNDEWFATKILPYLSNDNLKEGVVITCVNITEQKRKSLSEANGKQSGFMELEMQAVAGQLSAGIAQEIRNPLLALKEFTKLNESMTSELDRIEAMMNELIILAPPLMMEFTRSDVVGMLNDVIALFEPQAILKEVEILVKFSVPELFIRCVRAQLKQLFINILNKGLNSMPQGGDMIIKLKANGKTAVISFSEGGAEIPRSKQDENSKKENAEGLDMMIINKIIENHQAAISFKSLPGKGNVVEIELRV
ncbi:unnamed protein product [Aphanomyces euteiches]